MRNSPPSLAFAETCYHYTYALEIEPLSQGVFPPQYGARQIIH